MSAFSTAFSFRILILLAETNLSCDYVLTEKNPNTRIVFNLSCSPLQQMCQKAYLQSYPA